MQLETQTLVDVHDHSLAVDGWRQQYQQMTSGRFESVLMQARGSDFHLFRERTNRQVVQRGKAPDGVSSIAVPLEPLAATFQGQRVDGLALLTLPSGTTFEFYTPETTHFVGISLAASELEALIELSAGATGLRMFRQGVIPVQSDSALQMARRLRMRLDEAQRCDAGFWHYACAEKDLRDDVVAMMLSMVEAGSAEPKRDLTHRTYVDIVQRCDRLLDERGDTPVSVLDLCQHLRISRRTLQTSFQRVAQLSPVTYLRSVRLNRVRQLLRCTSSHAVPVGDAAARWGFTHQSYFAREYRKLFDELPSATPRLS